MEYRFLMKYKHPNMHIRPDDFKISLSGHTDYRYIRHIHLAKAIEKEFNYHDLKILKEIANMYLIACDIDILHHHETVTA